MNTPMPGQARRPRLESLTGLRAGAALLVFFHHTLAPSIVNHGLAQIPHTSQLAYCGMVGVTFFFVLSGFVLAWSYNEQLTTFGFLGRRLARVWPTHVVVYLAAVVAVLPLLHRPHGSPDANVLGVLLLQSWSTKVTVYFAGNFVAWSLSCELFFYALLPCVMTYVRRGTAKAGWWTVAGCFGYLAFLPLVVRAVAPGGLLDLWVFPAYRVAEFVIGVVAGWALRSGWRPMWNRATAAGVVAFAYVAAAATLGKLFFSATIDDRPLGNLYVDLALVLPLTALIVAVAAHDAADQPSALRSTLAVRLGTASFAFYLVHGLAVLAAARQHYGHRALHGVPLTALTLVVALVIADLLHHGLERPVEARLRAWLVTREHGGSAALN